MTVWAYCMTLKDSTSCTPFKMIYGLDVVIPTKYVSTLIIVIFERLRDATSNFSRSVTLENLLKF